jgi:hypothetical protein
MHYIIAAHIIFSILLAYLGRNSRLKFWGVLLTSLYMTPLVVGVMLLFFGTTCPKLAKKKELSPVTPNTPEKKARRRFSFGAA